MIDVHHALKVPPFLHLLVFHPQKGVCLMLVVFSITLISKLLMTPNSTPEVRSGLIFFFFFKSINLYSNESVLLSDILILFSSSLFD